MKKLLSATAVTAINVLLEPTGKDIRDLIDCEKNSFEKKYLTVEEAEKYSGIKRWTLMRKAKLGLIKYSKLSPAKAGKVLIEKQSLDDYLEQCRISPSDRKNSNALY